MLLAAALPPAATAQDPAPAPVATTGPAESIGQTAATLTGTIDRNGGLTTYHFEYGPSAAYGQTTPENTAPADGSDPVLVKAPIQGLARGATYHYRLVATGLGGAISRGADRTFRTAAGPRAPAVTSTGARDVGPRSARLITTADPNGQETSVRFEYGRTTGYGSFTDRVSVGAGDRGVPVSIVLDGLRPNTRYHFCAVATNATGSARSLDRSFRTAREPTGVSIAVTPARVLWGRRLSVIGRIAGTAVGGARVALERQDFPFTESFRQVGASKTATPNGSFRFELPGLFVTSHFRVVTRTKVVVASAIRTASSAVKVGARTRSRGRKRTRIEGSIWPRVPAGRVSLQKRSPRGRWAVVRRAAARPLDEDRSRYRFTVTRAKKRVGRYRVVVLARDGGAHVPGRSREVRVRALRRG